MTSPKHNSRKAACECDGSGRIVDTLPEGEWQDIGNGLQARSSGGFSSRVCACRWALPRRTGVASWWTTGTTFSEEIDLPTGPTTVEISVSTEVPVSDDGYLLIRDADNIYWPSLIHIGDNRTFTSDDVRTLAAALIRAADKADELDNAALSSSVASGAEHNE